MKTIQLSANFGVQKSYENLLISKMFYSFKTNRYEQYFNPKITKKKVLKEMVKQKNVCKEVIGKIRIMLARQKGDKGARQISIINITQEDIDRTKRQMYPKKTKFKQQQRIVRRTHNNSNLFFNPMM